MTKYVDLVIGPETGILNAAGCFDTPKITMLSHSSHENLCKYWKNDFCIAPSQEEVFCHPCHTLHYIHSVNNQCITCSPGTTHTLLDIPAPLKAGDVGGMWTCPYEAVPGTIGKDDGAGVPSPLCTTRLKPEMVMARIQEVYKLWKTGKFARKELSLV